MADLSGNPFAALFSSVSDAKQFSTTQVQQQPATENKPAPEIYSGNIYINNPTMYSKK